MSSFQDLEITLNNCTFLAIVCSPQTSNSDDCVSWESCVSQICSEACVVLSGNVHSSPDVCKQWAVFEQYVIITFKYCSHTFTLHTPHYSHFTSHHSNQTPHTLTLHPSHIIHHHLHNTPSHTTHLEHTP